MSKLKEVFTQKFTEYLQVNELTPGTQPVAVDQILNSFKTYAPTVPVTKALLGRALSQSFLKKQQVTTYGLSQCYYMNKSV